MRITNSMLVQNALRGMRARLGDLSQAQSRATTLRRLNAMSDDPVSGAELSRIDSTLRDVAQYRRNATSARTRLSVEDTVLTSMRKLVSQARTLATSVAALADVDPARQRALQQLGDVQEQLVALGNTKIGGEYLFGGAKTATPPFLSDGTYVGDSTVRSVQLDQGVSIETVHAGDHSIGGALLSLTTLHQSVATETEAQITASVSNLRAYEDQLLSDQAEVGSRLQVIAEADTRLVQTNSSTLDRRDALDAVDPAEALVTVQSAQTALERAYAVVGRVMQTNLLDYLK